jgi:hypothetical protein
LEPAPNSKVEPQKRRSARIVQAVPLTVSGIDALGRPFLERTSTLVINCHGCRYQSKHYVLKNMWVTIEVPHPDSGSAPRVARGRVMWIQRPRTVRELFQVGIELEVPGNLWGIAFTPPDWFALPQGEASEVRASVTQESPAIESREWDNAAGPIPVEDNVRTMPSSGSSAATVAGEISLAMTRQMRQQLQVAIRESAAEAVSEETRPLLTALQSQIKEVAERSVEAVAEATARQAVGEVLSQNEHTHEERLKELHEKWNAALDQSIAQAGVALSGRLGEMASEHGAAFERKIAQHLDGVLEGADGAARDLAHKISRAQEHFDEFDKRVDARTVEILREVEQRVRAATEEASGRITELERAARQLHERIAAAESGWQARLESDWTAATERWNQEVETSLERAAQHASERLMQTSRQEGERLEQELRSRLAAARNEFAESRSLVEGQIEVLRATLAGENARAHDALRQTQIVSQSLEEWPAKVGELTKAAQLELERRASAVVEAESRQLASRAQESIAAWTERLEPALETAARRAVSRLGEEMEQQLGARLETAGRVLGNLDEGTRTAQAGVHAHQEALMKASQREIEKTITLLQESIGRVEQDFSENARAAVAKWLAELEVKASETNHATFESLFKTADWYEKKVQTQMQAALEKGIEQATAGLREKAGELSGLFATELDHYSRSYVAHTQEQVEEGTQDLLQRLNRQASEIVFASGASLAQRTQEQADAAVAGFRQEAAGFQEAFSAEVRARADESHEALVSHVREIASDFRASLVQEAEKAVAHVRRDMSANAELASEELRAAGESLEKHLRGIISTASGSAVDEYKHRLENASNSWLLATMAKLNQQSERHVEEVAHSTEERLRETCGRVFADVGESLRRRMLELLTSPSPDNPSA